MDPLNLRDFRALPVFEAKRHVWIFQCPTCKKKVRFDSNMEPLCTGPNETTDDHEMMMMNLIGIEVGGRSV